MKNNHWFYLLLGLLWACQQQEQTKASEKKPYLQSDTAYVSKYTKYDRETFNHIVDGFPNLYQYPPIHPDSAFAQKTYMEYFDKNGEKQCIDFDVTGNTIDFYDLYAGFLRHKVKANEAEKQKLNKNLMMLSKIHNMIGEPTQDNWLNEGKIPALVAYGMYVQSTQRQINPIGFEQRKEAYINHLKSLMKEMRLYDALPNDPEKNFLRLVFEINIETDFDIEQCKSFEKLYDYDE